MSSDSPITQAEAAAIVDAMGAMLMAIASALTPDQQAGIASTLRGLALHAERAGNPDSAQLISDLSVAAEPRPGA